VRRPLLSLRRADTVQLCTTLGIEAVDDPSNSDPRHLRNRVRHELVPLMNELARRDVVPVLTRQADISRADADLLDELAAHLDVTDAAALATAPLPLARRAVRRWLTTTHPPDLATVDRVLAVARGDSVATETADGRRVSRHRQRLMLHPSASTGPND
jgi:tRNA(Ile)-lysidine synthase